MRSDFSFKFRVQYKSMIGATSIIESLHAEVCISQPKAATSRAMLFSILLRQRV